MILECANLKKSFNNGKLQILKGIDLKLNKGEKLGLIGRSGSGKSTLLGLLAGLDRLDSGELKIDGESIKDLSESELSFLRGHKIGFVFQQFHLIESLSALENVLLPLEIIGEPDEKKALDLLAKVGLEDRAHHFPSQLSGGESQRVALARALIHNPKIILADEPSGSLDDETGKSVMDLFFKIIDEQKQTLILVTHDTTLAKRCGRVEELKNGVLVKC